MDAWSKLIWNGPVETDSHRSGARNPYQQREAQVCHRVPKITYFLSRDAVGDNLTASKELLLRSRQLIDGSSAKLQRGRTRLLMLCSHKRAQ